MHAPSDRPIVYILRSRCYFAVRSVIPYDKKLRYVTHVENRRTGPCGMGAVLCRTDHFFHKYYQYLIILMNILFMLRDNVFRHCCKTA